MPLTAITRKVSPAMNACELTHIGKKDIDPDKAATQHAKYERLLADLGCDVRSLPAEPDLPDSVFVEDTAVVLDEAAVMTRPGAASRRPEPETIARALQEDRHLVYIEKPGTLDGGDVLLIDRTLYCGRTSRSNRAGREQLRELVAPFGYTVQGVDVSGCLHLKTAVTRCAAGTVLLNPDWVHREQFDSLRHIEVDPREPFGANVLCVNHNVVYATAYPRTRERLEKRGLAVRALDLSELAKAEGAVTCCSLLLTTK
ncbi:MAG: amidinotransferase [Desulfohalobiaceae bacterium]|nr:amidinotransferase [Desulfohalobiaceae bacterium]